MKKRILYVEDDEEFIRYLKNDVEKVFDVDVAKNKYDCLTKLGEQSQLKYDIVLLDLYWSTESKGEPSPDEGFEILHEIRKCFSPDELPIVIYTGAGVEKDALRALRHEVQDWLWKDSTPAEKIWRIRRSIGMRKINKLVNDSEKGRSVIFIAFSIYILSICTYLFINDKIIFAIILLIPLLVAGGFISTAKLKLKTAISEFEADITNEENSIPK